MRTWVVAPPGAAQLLLAEVLRVALRAVRRVVLDSRRDHPPALEGLHQALVDRLAGLGDRPLASADRLAALVDRPLGLAGQVVAWDLPRPPRPPLQTVGSDRRKITGMEERFRAPKEMPRCGARHFALFQACGDTDTATAFQPARLNVEG